MSRVNVIDAGTEVWEKLRGKKIFLTGGTGFFGRSFLELITAVDAQKKLNLHITILTRDSGKFTQAWKDKFNFEMLDFAQGDISNFSFPDDHYDYILHFATPASATLNVTNPLEMFNIILDGSRRILEFAKHAKIRSFLFTSSGAAYGKQPWDMTHVPETYAGAPLTQLTTSAYGEAKRAAELLGNIYAKTHGFEHKIARCFAFVGPHLDPNGTFAIGNFIRDASQKNKIEVKGDGTPYRSYMYSDDLVLWLLKILLDGESGKVYNVGSDEDVTIAELAKIVFKALGKKGNVDILSKPKDGALPERYVPSIEMPKQDLGLKIWTGLEEAIQETAKRYQSPK